VIEYFKFVVVMNEFKFVNDIVTKYGFTAISNKQMKRII